MVDVPAVAIPFTLVEDSKNHSLRSDIAADGDMLDLPTDLSKNQDVREVLVDEVSTRNRNQLVDIDNMPKEQEIRQDTRETEQDREAGLSLDADIRHDSECRNKSPRLDGLRSVEKPAGKEEQLIQDRLYGQVMHDEIPEDRFRSRSIAEDHRSMQRDDLQQANVTDDLGRGYADGFMGTRDGKKRRKKKNVLEKRNRSEPPIDFVDQPQSRPTSPPPPHDQCSSPAILTTSWITSSTTDVICKNHTSLSIEPRLLLRRTVARVILRVR